jgi:hypothetical protein
MPQNFRFLLFVNAAILAAFAQHFTNVIIPAPTDGTAEAGQPLQTVSAHPNFYDYDVRMLNIYRCHAEYYVAKCFHRSIILAPWD